MSEHSPFSHTYKVAGFIIISILLRYLTLSTGFGMVLSLLPIGLMAMVRLLSYKQAVISSIVTLGILFFLGDSLQFILFHIISVMVVSWFYHKKDQDLFSGAFIYSLMSLLIIYLSLFFTGGETTLTILIYVQMYIALIMSALLIDMITLYVPYLPYLRKFNQHKKPVFFGQIIFNAVVVVAILPLITLTLVNGLLMENQVINYYQEEVDELKYMINDRVEQFDDDELRALRLGSGLSQGYLIEAMDQFIGEKEAHIYFFDRDHVLFSNTHSSPYHEMNQRLLSGHIVEVAPHQMIWFEKRVDYAPLWFNAHFIERTSFIDYQVEFIFPMQDQIQIAINQLFIYYSLIMIIFFITFLTGLFARKMMTKQLKQLNHMASQLPIAMTTQTDIKVPDSRIYEFQELGDHLAKVGQRLKQMFVELNQKNCDLEQATKELKVSQENLFQEAYFDNLTQLPNRRSFYENVPRLIDEENQPFAMFFIDLDDFKRINDQYGHSGGDQLLKIMADRFSRFVSMNDGIQLYRLAGDEFVMIMLSKSKDEVMTCGEELIGNITSPIQIDQFEETITASIGVSFYPEHGSSLDQLLNVADQAMYNLKYEDKNGLRLAPLSGDDGL
ncbi:diguanylate cyclase (GGDEF) domain-containing protein [Pelagirhabdus alkalitolerans]|uniref:Diguanylate cyclase (GGDEF) domain-containing protein n=1 Tax=Pelagirhabdus alkalitolerans TaxID=1612202 RepID=A0A1G6KZU1_9BACI|nr:GGDEF domain-containing protein [Pelagirhabdus alkalitolerans]SDC36610.1 diguanylate cyclase (GGDEF) domain-containing protein [Pelagirhabdus alkalitolerans]